MITITTINNSWYFINDDFRIRPNETEVYDETTLTYRQVRDLLNAEINNRIVLSEADKEILNSRLSILDGNISESELKTINGESILGSGDISVGSSTGDPDQYLDDLGSSVHISGGNLVPTGGVNFLVEAGTGYARAEDGTLKRITWNATTSATVYPGDNYIVINSNSEIINLSANSISSNGLYVPLGYIFTNATNTTMLGLSNIRLTGKDNLYRIAELFRTTLGSLVESGCSTAMQASPNQLQVTISAGKIWNSLNRYGVVETSSFNKIFKHNSGFDFDILTAPNTINNTHYNVSSNPINSCIVEMTAGFYKKDIIGLTPTGVAYYLYGTSEHETLEEAKIAPLPQVPENIKNSIVRSCAIIIQKGAPEVAELLDIRPIFQRIFEVGAAASNATVISHDALVDLATDSHLQYLNEIRGDIRYYRKAEVDTALTAKAAEDHLHSIVTNTENGFMRSSDKTKLDTIEANATVNETDYFLRDRANHTGTQDISTINNLSTTLNSKQDSLVSGTNLKTINGESLLGAGNISVSANSAALPPNNNYTVYSDFVTLASYLSGIGLSTNLSGTGTKITNVVPNQTTHNKVGMSAFTSGNTSGAYVTLRETNQSHDLSALVEGDTLVIKVSFLLDRLSTVANDYSVRIGFTNSNGPTSFNNGVYLEYNNTTRLASLSVNMLTFDNFATQPALTTNSNSENLVSLKIQRISGTLRTTCTLNGETVVSTTPMPSGPLGAMVQLIKGSAVSTSAILTLDWIEITRTFATPRNYID